MLDQFDELVAPKGYPWKIREILPKVLVAGEAAGILTERERSFWMSAVNWKRAFPYVRRRETPEPAWQPPTACVSVRVMFAGTSVFAMLDLEKELSTRYPEIDMVTTPAGDSVAMVHSNNCTSDLNAWVGLL